MEDGQTKVELARVVAIQAVVRGFLSSHCQRLLDQEELPDNRWYMFLVKLSSSGLMRERIKKSVTKEPQTTTTLICFPTTLQKRGRQHLG